jgi:hypothetical protein
MKNFKLISCLLLLALAATSCRDLVVKPTAGDLNMEDFEAAWKRVHDVYPFLEFKKIDWDLIYTRYRPRVEKAEGDEFYLVLGDLLAELQDGHVYYRTDGGDEVYPFYPQRHIKDRHAYSPIVVRSYFDTSLLLTKSGSAEYGITPDNIGYVFLSDFHKEYLKNEFPGIVQFLSDTRGMIIDIRQKRGGSLDNVYAVVSRFITAPLAKPKLYLLGKLVEQTPFQPLAGTFIYTNRVVVLINGSTFSAGEHTAEILKQLPQVTAVGDVTGGGGAVSSDQSIETAAEYRLPSGKVICVGSGYIERYDGQLIEWNGVPPDIYVEQTETDVLNGRDKQLEFAIDLLKQL